MTNKTYIIGHKNPDTDSIVSAIAYAEYKKQLGFNVVPARIGSTNSETEYLLERFSFEDPIRLYTARCLLKEIEIDSANLITKDTTIKEALDLALTKKNRTLIVVNKQKQLEGIVSLGDLTYMWTLSDKKSKNIMKTIRLKNVKKIIKGKVVNIGEENFSGEIHVFPSFKSKIQENSIVLLRNESELINFCIDNGSKLVIVVTSTPISQKVVNNAKKHNTSIVTSEMSPLSITRLIYQIPTVEYVMNKRNKIDYFTENDNVFDVSSKIAKSRHRSYPVVDDEERVVGSVSRYHLFNYKKKSFILVDHNEFKQTIDDIDDGEILEIVDHHRFGGLETESPIDIITMSVGATATIIANMFFENNMKLNKRLAGLLLGAIISDTMNFKSPTTTDIDINIGKKLEKISGIKINELSSNMIEHSESLLSKRLIEIVFNDFKEFNINGVRIGLSQSPCKSVEEFNKLKSSLSQYLDDSCKTSSYDVIAIMLTNPNGSGSYLLAGGNKAYIINEIYKDKARDYFVKGLVSRKKQLLPSVINELNK